MFASFGVEVPLSCLVGEGDSRGRGLVARAVQAPAERKDRSEGSASYPQLRMEAVCEQGTVCGL